MICKWYSLPSNADFNKLREILLVYCSCIDVETNLQSYITIEGHEEECVDEVAQHLIDEGCIMNDGEVYNKPKVVGIKRILSYN